MIDPASTITDTLDYNSIQKAHSQASRQRVSYVIQRGWLEMHFCFAVTWHPLRLVSCSAEAYWLCLIASDAAAAAYCLI